MSQDQRENVRVALQLDTCSFDVEGNSANENFTTHSNSNDEWASSTKSSNEEEMLVSFAKELETNCESLAFQTLNSANM